MKREKSGLASLTNDPERFYARCPYCGTVVRFAGWQQQRRRLVGFECERKVKYVFRQVRMRWEDGDFGVCPACHGAVSSGARNAS